MIRITDRLMIDEQDLQEVFIQASGPGGQHVNKVATAVQLRFHVRRSSLPVDVQHRLSSLAGRKMTEDGVLVIDARRFRSQERNREDARDRLIELIRRAAQRPKSRHSTKPTFASQQRRLNRKRQRANIKKMRRFNSRLDDE